MLSNVPQGVLYLPVLAVWITLVGQLINREPVYVLAPQVLAFGLGVTMAVGDLPWLFLPVMALWLLGVAVMLRRHRHDTP